MYNPIEMMKTQMEVNLRNSTKVVEEWIDLTSSKLVQPFTNQYCRIEYDPYKFLFLVLSHYANSADITKLMTADKNTAAYVRGLVNSAISKAGKELNIPREIRGEEELVNSSSQIFQ